MARRILLVDDNVDAAELLGMLLETDGYEVRIANNGEDALRIAREFSPHVAVLDLGLPDIAGDEVGRRIGLVCERPFLIAITGWGDDAHRRRTSDAGFDAHLVKPVDCKRLRPLLETALRRR